MKPAQSHVSQLVDAKEVAGTEEKLDRKMREEGVWDFVSWREERK